MFEMEESELKQKVDFYQKQKTIVHIETFNGRFYNGIILDSSDKHLVLNDRKIGELFLNFSEISLLEKNKWLGVENNE